eukprot:g21252.t1
MVYHTSNAVLVAHVIKSWRQPTWSVSKNEIAYGVYSEVYKPVSPEKGKELESQPTLYIMLLILLYTARITSDPHFLTTLQSLLDGILQKVPTTTITIVGDLNYDMLKLKYDTPLYNFLLSNNLYTTIATCTRLNSSSTARTLLDTYLTNINSHIISGTIEPPLSDYLPIYAIIHKHCPRQERLKGKRLTIGRYERLKEKIVLEMKEEMERNDQKPGMTSDSALRHIQVSIEKVATKYETAIKHRKNQPWCSNRIKRMINRQKELHWKRRQNPAEENIRKHAQYRNQLRKTIKWGKREQLTRLQEETKHSPKRQTGVLRSVVPNAAKQRNAPCKLTYEGVTYTEPQQIADALNDYFITVGKKTGDMIPNDCNDDLATVIVQESSRTFQLKLTSYSRYRESNYSLHIYL